MAEERLGPIMAFILESAKNRLTKKATRVVVMPGATVVEDDCCEGGGTLYVRVISIVGVSGLSNANSQPCVPLYQVRLGLGTRRCAHTVSDTGVPPSEAEMTADAFSILQDRSDLMQALNCDVWPMIDNRNDIANLKIEDWLPTPVLGGCIGCEITMNFQQVLCLPCTDPEEN